MNLVIASLATADLMKGIVYPAYAIARHVVSRDCNAYLLGSFLCKYEHFFKMATNGMHHVSIMCLVVARLSSVFSSCSLGQRATLAVMIGLWLTFSGVMVAAVNFVWISQLETITWSDRRLDVCLEQQRWGNDFWVTYMFLVMIVPLISLVAMYAITWLLARRVRRAALPRVDEGSSTAERVTSHGRLSTRFLLVYVIEAAVIEVPSQVYMLMRSDDALWMQQV